MHQGYHTHTTAQEIKGSNYSPCHRHAQTFLTTLALNTYRRCLLKFILLLHQYTTTQGIYNFIGNIWPAQEMPTSRQEPPTPTKYILQKWSRFMVSTPTIQNTKEIYTIKSNTWQQELQHDSPKNPILHRYLVDQQNTTQKLKTSTVTCGNQRTHLRHAIIGL